MNETILFLTLAAAIIVVWHCLCSLNMMSHGTDHGLRLAVIAMGGGAFAELVGIAAGDAPGLPELLLLGGFVAMIISNRRQTSCPCLVMPLNRSNAPDGKLKS